MAEDMIPTLVTVKLSRGSFRRLQRIQELKMCDEVAAVEYAIAYGWVMAENGGYKPLMRLRSEDGLPSQLEE